MREKLDIVAIAFGHGLVHWYFTGFFLIIPFILDDFDLSFTQAGLLVSYRTVISAIVNFPSSALVDWLGKRRLVLAGSILWSAVIYLVVGWSPNYLFLQVFVALVGIGGSIWHPAAMSTLSNRMPERRGFALSVHEFGANMGDALVPAAIGALLVVMSWRGALYLNAIPGIIIAIALWTLVGKGEAAKATSARIDFSSYLDGVKSMFTNRMLLALSTLSGLRTMSQNVVNTFLPIYLISGLAMTSDRAGLYMTMLTFPALFSGLIVGTLSDRTGRRPTMLFGLTVSTIMMFVLGLTKSGPLFVGSLVLLGLFLFSIRPVIFAYGMEVTRKEMGATTIGFMFSVNQVFASFSPLVAGYIADQAGLIYTFYVAGIMVLGSVLISLTLPLIMSREKVPTPAPGS